MITCLDNLAHLQHSHNRPVNVDITGGEPTLVPQLVDMLNHAKNTYGLNITMTSNGSASFDTYKVIMCFISCLTISIHFEYVKDIEALKNKLMALNQCHPKKLRINIMCIPGTIEQSQQLFEWAEDNAIKAVVRRVRPSYDQETKTIVRPYSYNKYPSILIRVDGDIQYPNKDTYYSPKELIALRQMEKISTWKNTILTFEDGHTEHINANELLLHELNSYTGWQCHVRNETLRIKPSGELFFGSCMIIPTNTNIYEQNTITMVNEPITCTKTWCISSTDQNNERYAP